MQYIISLPLMWAWGIKLSPAGDQGGRRRYLGFPALMPLSMWLWLLQRRNMENCVKFLNVHPSALEELSWCQCYWQKLIVQFYFFIFIIQCSDHSYKLIKVLFLFNPLENGLGKYFVVVTQLNEQIIGEIIYKIGRVVKIYFVDSFCCEVNLTRRLVSLYTGQWCVSARLISIFICLSMFIWCKCIFCFLGEHSSHGRSKTRQIFTSQQ